MHLIENDSRRENGRSNQRGIYHYFPTREAQILGIIIMEIKISKWNGMKRDKGAIISSTSLWSNFGITTAFSPYKHWGSENEIALGTRRGHL